ncbi:error-prone DNA polymerase [Streptomyces alkaliterrae]|uniref:Error-prone DNA polymerase n=1 Tax=Streptomyces alkaliterrae TaxID=2213162 RepID=A0A5P0YXI6_9ACTN|nr:error-prone DNA polymerase [Streptomyces alkaliterrae]MBB1259819.1 error-prone DNA polymerase [Streptomyces alkaliterrae]MQS04998.1 DNA polymerase III subunit alpha [Streptomyces alkaliterrae]
MAEGSKEARPGAARHGSPDAAGRPVLRAVRDTPTCADELTVPWAELHTHSGFSFLQGACDPAELVEEAARLGVGVLGLTDRDGLYGARRLEGAARRAGVRTVFGAELSLQAHELGRVVVLARSTEGFRRLSAALSAAQLAGAKGAPVYDLAALSAAARHDGWAVLTGCPRTGPADPGGPGGEAVAEYDDPADVDAVVRRIRRLADVFGRQHVHAELIDHRLPEDSPRNHTLFAAARRTGVRTVASGAVHYAAPRQARLSQALAALRRREDLERAAGHLHPAPTAHLRSGAEMAAWLERFPGVREATLALGEECALDLSALRPRLPGFPVPDGHAEDSWLRRLVQAAGVERYGPPPGDNPSAREAWRQLEHELGIIGQLGMAGYFLIVHDIVEFARRAGIWCQGRGSAASSLVCHVLGVTAVDPLRHGLLFERFLSVERSEAPDIDIDFEHRRREEVISYVYERYGREHAAQVANVITYRPRLAVRDAARALGYPPERVDELSSRVHHHRPASAGRELPPDVAELAGQLEGLPRHLGIHSAGMVLTRQPVGEFVPVEWATAEGRSVLQGDKDDVEAAGLVKIDLLGLGMLSALHDACDLAARHQGVRHDLGSIPPDDPAVYEMIARADTVGVFQVESRAQMSTLPRLAPEKFEDLVVAVSLIRPGPIQGGSVHPYMRRRAGREKVDYPHPLAERALRRSLGVPLWQEQMMELAVDCAGFTPGEADELRKALSSKRSVERVGELRGRLMRGMARNGIGRRTAERIYHMVEGFSGYGFPQSHAQSMAHLVYASAWLRLHHPAAFTAALLRNQPMGFYSPLSLIADARRRGVEVRGVDVLRSDVRDTLESREAAGEPAIRLGLWHVKGLGEAAAARIVDGRPYTDLADLARRVRLPAAVMETLATAGAFAGLGVGRREALWAAGPLSRADEDTLPGTTPVPEAPALPPMNVVEETFGDLWATGSTTGRHPVEHLRGLLREHAAVPVAEVFTLPDRATAVVGGLVTHRQRPPTAGGVVFLTLEDESGMANIVIRPEVWERYARAVLDHPAVLVHGRVERADGATSVLALRVTALPSLVPAPQPRRGRGG